MSAYSFIHARVIWERIVDDLAEIATKQNYFAKREMTGNTRIEAEQTILLRYQ